MIFSCFRPIIEDYLGLFARSKYGSHILFVFLLLVNWSCFDPDAVLSVSVTKVDATGTALADGRATIHVNGGDPPFQFQWSNGGDSDSSRTNLLPGFYNVVVVDAIGVKDSIMFEIGVSGGANILNILVNSTYASTPYTPDGNASATVNGGTPPYTYAWSNGGSGSTISNLMPGNYSLTVYDSQSNFGTKNFTVGLDPTFPTIQWVQIPAGSFIMGSPNNEAERSNDEGPQTVVSLSAFKMSKYEITFAQYDTFCDATGRAKPADEGWGRGSRPVVNVSWDDAVAFAAWMGPGYRLPTEAEWEYACRAGTTTPFNTGLCLSTSQANYNGNYPYPGCSAGSYLVITQPVGSYAPNAWGLYDMHGNVLEWCSDWYGSYSGVSQNNPTGPASGYYRVLRGGGWNGYGGGCRSANRGNGGPSNRYINFGFRLVVPS